MAYKITTVVATEPVTATEAKLHLKVEVSTDDDLITALITAAREMAEHYTCRALAQQTVDLVADEFPSGDDDRINLPLPPVASVTHVKYYDTDGVLQTIDSGDYALSAYGDTHFIAPTYGNYWPSTRDIPDAVQIRFVTGHGATGQTSGSFLATIPKAAKAAILLIIGHLYENRGDTATETMPMAARALLDTVKVYGR